jgi:hypothetical protein
VRVPEYYVRINSIKTYPKYILQRLLNYPSAIHEDSDFENDSEVLKKYKGKNSLMLIVYR